MAKLPFNVDAYTARLIGRENVSKLDGAILELVKNTYDADASACLIYYEDSTESLYISDNGIGMTEDIIIKHWMTIGNSSKTTDFETLKGRIQTGAKGIGRFALDRIGDQCEMLTISAVSKLLWSVDWSSFYSGRAITEITADLSETDSSLATFFENIKNPYAREFIKLKFITTGTVFKINLLRDRWSAETINRIKSKLSTLIPFEFREAFNIYFFDETASIDEATILHDNNAFSYDYKIEFDVKQSGATYIKLFRSEFDFKDDFNRVMLGADFAPEEREYFNGTPIVSNTTFSEILPNKEIIQNTIGNFNGVIYFFKRSVSKSDIKKYYYKDISSRRDFQDTFGGVKIYRDNFRVRPYGEANTSSSDWLLLASRKNRSPAAITHHTGAWRVNSDQILGSIYISRMNLTLPDQSNREGIVETHEFLILKQFILAIIRKIEKDRQDVFRKLSEYADKMNPTAKIEEEINRKTTEENKNKAKKGFNANGDYKTEFIEVSRVKVVLDKKDSAIKDLEDENRLLRVLATTGIITNTYIHEMKNLTHLLNLNIVSAKEALELDNDIKTALVSINNANNLRSTFTSWFKVTIESVRRDKRIIQNISLNKLLTQLISSWSEILKPKFINIVLSVSEICFECYPFEVESIINNLIANSVSSFERSKTNNKEICIRIEPNESGIEVIYSDNGSGLSSAYKNDPKLILDAFESDNRSEEGEVIGTGMGMWIINRTVSDYNGSVDLSENNRTISGFYIKITLNGNKQ